MVFLTNVLLDDKDANIGKSGGPPVKYTFGRESTVDFNGVVSFKDIKNGKDGYAVIKNLSA